MAYEQVLSQDEVDALLRGVTGGAVDQSSLPTTPQDGLPSYDLGAPDRVVRSRMHTLEVINERFGPGRKKE